MTSWFGMVPAVLRGAKNGLLLATTLIALAQSGCAAGPQTTPASFSKGWVGQGGPLDPPVTPPAPVQAPPPPVTEAEIPVTVVPAPVPPPTRCPSEMTLVQDETCIDKWESSLVEVRADGTETPWSPYHSPKGAKGTLRSVSLPGVVPQGYINGEQAEAACEASNKRLCFADEWEAACRGEEFRTYPYGDERQENVCNDDGRDGHPVIEAHRKLGLPKEGMWRGGMAHPFINQLDDTLEKTGELNQCTNDIGAFDMVGNLHEWIADPDGTFRGGFYMDTKINGEGCSYATTAHPMTYADYSTGFRCCLDAAPPDAS